MRLDLDLYKNDADNSHRFLLGKNGTRMLAICGINPSTADDQHSDMTLTKVMNFAHQWGFHGFVMVNLYPLRATRPKDLSDTRDLAVVLENISSMVQIFSHIKQPTIWAAWGNTIERRNYLTRCLQEIVNALRVYTPKWVHAGEFTVKKHPRHPSRLSYSSHFQQFDIDHYVQRLVGKSE